MAHITPRPKFLFESVRFASGGGGVRHAPCYQCTHLGAEVGALVARGMAHTTPSRCKSHAFKKKFRTRGDVRHARRRLATHLGAKVGALVARGMAHNAPSLRIYQY